MGYFDGEGIYREDGEGGYDAKGYYRDKSWWSNSY